MKPSDSRFPGAMGTFSNGRTYFIGLFDNPNPNFAEYIYPALLRKETDGTWSEIDWRQPIYKDLQEDIDPKTMVRLVIEDFNQTIQIELANAGTYDPADYNKDGTIAWVEQLARFLEANVVVDGDRFVLNI